MTTDPVIIIEGDPGWLPHSIDWSNGTAQFQKFPHEQFRAPGFLFEFQPEDSADKQEIPISRLRDIRVETLPIHFVFHTAFCRSTLLSRALNMDGIAVGMSEPGIIASLVNAPAEFRPILSIVLRLLARQRTGVSAIFVKPTNHANRLIPEIMEASPDSRAIFMTCALKPFLNSVRKRGLMGHRWGRKLYLEVQQYAGLDLGMSPTENFAMSDLQAAGLAWFLYQNYFTNLASGPYHDRVRTLDAEFFDRNHAETVQRILNFCLIDSSSFSPETLENAPLFSEYSKGDGEIRIDTPGESTENEISQVQHWLEIIARQMGIRAPVQQSLA
ncbi:hypothetical protein [Qipengyuania sp. NPDC077563]|uniref:hypothetical protein n=1 Tax=Qipengyuania sp. NPDC077563 TaxID=3364497 RepID=UPI00384C4B2D